MASPILSPEKIDQVTPPLAVSARARPGSPSRRFVTVAVERPLRPGDWLLIFLFALLVLVGLDYAALKPRHVAGETLGVLVFGGSPDAAVAAVAAAGGQLLRDGDMAGSVIARAPDAGFVDRLRQRGVSLVYRIDRSINCAGALPKTATGAATPTGPK